MSRFSLAFARCHGLDAYRAVRHQPFTMRTWAGIKSWRGDGFAAHAMPHSRPFKSKGREFSGPDGQVSRH